MGSSGGILPPSCPLCALVPVSSGAAQSTLLLLGTSLPRSVSTAGCPTSKCVSPAGLSWLCISSVFVMERKMYKQKYAAGPNMPEVAPGC